MSQPGKFALRSSSILTRMLMMTLSMAAVAILIAAVTAVNTARNAGFKAQQVSSQALRAQAEQTLVQITEKSASENDLILDQVSNNVKNIAAIAATLYSAPERFASPSFWPVDQHMQAGSEGQYSNRLDDVTSVYLPNTRTLDDAVRQDIQLSAYLDTILEPTLKNNLTAKAIYFGTQNDVLRYYPNIGLGGVLPPDFRVTTRPWYTGSLPEADPQRAVVWTPAYVDATGLGLVTTAAMPVYASGEKLVGVVGFDVTLDTMRAHIEATHFLKTGYSFLMDDSGHAIALTGQGYRDILGRGPAEGEVNPDLNLAQGSFKDIVEKMKAKQSGFQTVSLNGSELFVAYAPLRSTGWSMGSVVAGSEVLASLPALQREIDRSAQQMLITNGLPVLLVVAALMVAMGLLWVKRLVTPLQKLAEAARQIGAGQWDVQLDTRSNDELGLLARTFSQMAGELRGLIENLEQRVAERTRDLKRRSVQVQTAAEAARDITSARDLDTLLTHAVDLIRSRFSYYHAGIFLIDDLGEYAVLQAATGEAGQQMLANKHRLKVGEVGLVGYVTGAGQSRIALDVGEDAVHFKNPLLPDTRSEMALPLKVGGQVIGALDVQSTAGAAFDDEDLTLLQTLADQLAVAIENARLVERLEASLEETRQFYERQVRENWSLTDRRGRVPGFEYDRLHVAPAGRALPPEVLAQVQSGQIVCLETQPAEAGQAPAPAEIIVPVMLRGQMLGVIGVEAEDPAHRWLDDEIAMVRAVAAQAAMTLENARLLEEAQRRAERERLAGEISAKLRISNDPQVIMQTAAQELRLALQAHRAQVLVQAGEK
ncbi:MAG TPA: GAF domain-containing protein [Anaerolineales bacterium]